MAECPFCKAPIDEDVARFGGHCPKCVIEIPGEETPTDPGVAKRAEVQVAQERRRNWARALAVAGLAATVLASATAVMAWRVVQQREAQAKAMHQEQENGFYIAPASAHRLPVPGLSIDGIDAAAAEPDGRTGTRSSRRDHRGPSETSSVVVGAGSDGGVARYDFTAGLEEKEPELADLARRTVEVAPGSVESGGFGPGLPTIDINRGSVTSLALSDAAEIRESVGGALKSYAQQMTACYERRLKNSPDLRGTWDVSFTLQQSGRAGGVAVRGRQVADAELERCMSETVGRWTFQPMVEPQQIEKAYTFGTEE